MAGEATARAEAKRLAEHLRNRGITTSIELQKGRGDWHVPKYLVLNHHTASYNPKAGGNLTPALGICKTGRPDVTGPLCNGYGGYDGVFRIITMGLANHPGQGGPIVVDGVRVPKDSARPATFGIEWEGGYHTWTADERAWMARVNVALLEFYGRPVTSQLEHSTWTKRKVDRKDITRDIAIADARRVGSTLEKDMPLDAADKDWLRKLVMDSEARQNTLLSSVIASQRAGVPVLVKGNGVYADSRTPDPNHVAKWWAVDADGAEHIQNRDRANTLIASKLLVADATNQPFVWSQDQVDAQLDEDQLPEADDEPETPAPTG
jgi:hypothetical protein